LSQKSSKQQIEYFEVHEMNLDCKNATCHPKVLEHELILETDKLIKKMYVKLSLNSEI